MWVAPLKSVEYVVFVSHHSYTHTRVTYMLAQHQVHCAQHTAVPACGSDWEEFAHMREQRNEFEMIIQMCRTIATSIKRPSTSAWLSAKLIQPGHDVSGRRKNNISDIIAAAAMRIYFCLFSPLCASLLPVHTEVMSINSQSYSNTIVNVL